MADMGFTDWQQMGIWPLQDHQPGVPHSIRMAMVGGRVIKVPSPAAGDAPGVMQFAREGPQGTLGDVHPWFFWQTQSPGMRGMGIWSMAHSGLGVAGGTGGFPKKGTGQPVKPTGFKPFRIAHDVDFRLRLKYPNWPMDCMSSIPQGTMMMIMPGTAEGVQSEHMLHADPRLVAVNISKPAEAGTLVCDLQPEGELCMRGWEKDSKQQPKKDEPGIFGRAARLQSIFRVIPLKPDSLELITGEESDTNAIAFNCYTATQDGAAGWGMCWIKRDSGAGQGGPKTHPRPPAGPILSFRGGGGSGESSSFGGGKGGGGSGGGLGHAGGSGEKSNPCEFGEFLKKPEEKGMITLLAQPGSFGLLTGGDGAADKHLIGQDGDGNFITSSHVSTAAYFFMDKVYDAPLEFQRHHYPKKITEFRTKVKVNLVYDPDRQHSAAIGSQPGLWRWYSSTHVYVPPDGGDPPVVTPGTPAPPNGNNVERRRGGETPVSIPGITNLIRRDTRQHVGGINHHDRQVFEIFHPMTEGFAHLSFRPQIMRRGAVSLTRNMATEEEIELDEGRRPQVLTLKTWGAQNNGEWVYQQKPTKARVRGGTADGGILFAPPSYEDEDYHFSGRADVTKTGVDDASSPWPIPTSYVTCAPSVAFALGEPAENGGLKAKSWVIAATPNSLDANRPLLIQQLNSSAVGVTMLQAELDQSTSEKYVSVQGNQFLQIPRGTQAQQPAGWYTKAGGEIRIETNPAADPSGTVATDTLSWYDQQNTRWVSLRSTAQNQGASLIGIYDTGAKLAATEVNGALIEIITALDVVEATVAATDPTDYMHADGSVAGTGDQNFGDQDLYNIQTIAVGHSAVTTAALIEVQANPAATPDDAKSIALTNDTAATSGNQKYSPILRWQGAAYDSLGGASTLAAFRSFCLPVQASGGQATWVLQSKVGGGSWVDGLTLTSDKLLTHHGTAVGNGFDCNDAHIGTWIGSVNFAYFGHKAVKATSGSYSMLAQNDGATYLNAASSKLIYLRINNVTTAHLSANALHFPDNKGTYLGTGDDAAIYYDGSNVIVDPKVVGSGKITVPGSVYVADGFATGGSSRNAHITCWSDEAFGMELSGIGGAPCLLVYGRATDTDAIKFGTYTANSTAQSNFTQRAVLTSAGGFGVGVTGPAAGKVDAVSGFADNGVAGIDKSSFSFDDSLGSTHSVVISGGIITQWNVA